MITNEQVRKLIALKNECVNTALQEKSSKVNFTSNGRCRAAKARSKQAEAYFRNYVIGLAVGAENST